MITRLIPKSKTTPICCKRYLNLAAIRRTKTKQSTNSRKSPQSTTHTDDSPASKDIQHDKSIKSSKVPQTPINLKIDLDLFHQIDSSPDLSLRATFKKLFKEQGYEFPLSIQRQQNNAKVEEYLDDYDLDSVVECFDPSKPAPPLSHQYKLFLVENFLRQDRLDEMWFFIKYYYNWEPESVMKLIDYLHDSNQVYLIIPFISYINEETSFNSSQARKITAYGWSKLSAFLKNTYQEDSERWWKLLRLLWNLYLHENKSDRQKVFLTEMNDFVKFKTKGEIRKGFTDQHEKEFFFKVVINQSKINSPSFNIVSYSPQRKHFFKLSLHTTLGSS
ncbi:unnamed protein product [Ambrosiozyma monospora]|uniref:Unnamed protein product n=1 Tax=Ambrosiozyma monospora TaxID=43982 RepID=A0ACB5SXD3_AMBMO|nr:unnamed protein product [Ambrosiozyma monospora]